jgi:antitoxin component of RelBE/YafQ-DinJ toxin-antitoxin module
MKDTALVRMTINEIAKQKNISLDMAFDLFYNSNLCEMLSDRETGLFTYAPQDLARLL